MHIWLKGTNGNLPEVTKVLDDHGLRYQVIKGEGKTSIGVIGRPDTKTYERLFELFDRMEFVESITRVSDKFRESTSELTGGQRSTVELGSNFWVGGGTATRKENVGVIAGQCSLDDPKYVTQTIDAIAEINRETPGAIVGIRMMIWKPRSKPGQWEGLGICDLTREMYAEAKEKTGLPTVAEIEDSTVIDDYIRLGVDVFQVGARSSTYIPLIKALSQVEQPVIWKNPIDKPDVNDWSDMLGYLMGNGKRNVILCYRGNPSKDNNGARNNLSMHTLRQLSKTLHIPIALDPSHQGVREMVSDFGEFGLRMGADALLVETHPEPSKARTDGSQALYLYGEPADPTSFRYFMNVVRPYLRQNGTIGVPERLVASRDIRPAA